MSCSNYSLFNVEFGVTMKIIKFEDLRTIENPSPAQPYRMEIKLDGDGFKSLAGQQVSRYRVVRGCYDYVV
jgi:hypothetical protein